jgi:hypothetical protein
MEVLVLTDLAMYVAMASLGLAIYSTVQCFFLWREVQALQAGHKVLLSYLRNGDE